MNFMPDEAAESAERRVNLIAGLRDLAVWLDTHPGSPVPDVHAAFRVPGGPRAAEVDCVQDTADWLGVPMTQDEDGTLAASRDFGPVRAGVFLAPENPARQLAALPPFDDYAAAVYSWAVGSLPGGAA